MLEVDQRLDTGGESCFPQGHGPEVGGLEKMVGAQSEEERGEEEEQVRQAGGGQNDEALWSLHRI